MKLLEASGVSKAGNFEEIEKGRIRYSYATQLLMYPLGHRFMVQDMNYQPDQKYYDVLDTYVVADDLLDIIELFGKLGIFGIVFSCNNVNKVRKEGAIYTEHSAMTCRTAKKSAQNVSTSLV